MSNYIRYYNEAYNLIFITMVTHNRLPILIDNIELLRSSFKYVKTKHLFEIYACVVLKDHMHLIIKIDKNENYSEIIRKTKYYFSIKMVKNLHISESKINKREKGIWQRRFWEHTIRDDNDLNKHLDYIHFNPYKHYQISPKDWEYSTFKKFVKLGYYEENWCNFDDKNNILELNLE